MSEMQQQNTKLKVLKLPKIDSNAGFLHLKNCPKLIAKKDYCISKIAQIDSNEGLLHLKNCPKLLLRILCVLS